jgi:hypothetical protein
MREKLFCLDCETLREIDQHGRCSVCQSDAMCFGQSLRPIESEYQKVESWVKKVVDEAASR